MSLRYSAGVLLFRRTSGLEVLLGHMGGPLWAKKDASAWSIPKGEYEPAEEDPQSAARREFTEELGLPVPAGDWTPLGDVQYGSGRGKKQVTVWAVEADLDPSEIVPGHFDMEWPPRSGRIQQFPEIDRAAWFTPDIALDKLGKGQRPFLDRLTQHLAEQALSPQD
ncbi:NUDIX domain-containing protein [Nocardia sp. NPDC127526]|uniref:NUDIX domain-containing protein n=1 Tax=Nocardia sp. NPDC127526 TaxID=3345393 RepID=UPI0036313537